MRWALMIWTPCAPFDRALPEGAFWKRSRTKRNTSPPPTGGWLFTGGNENENL